MKIFTKLDLTLIPIFFTFIYLYIFNNILYKNNITNFNFFSLNQFFYFSSLLKLLTNLPPSKYHPAFQNKCLFLNIILTV